MRWIRYLEICDTFELERYIGLDDKALLEQLVNTINLQKLEEDLITRIL